MNRQAFTQNTGLREYEKYRARNITAIFIMSIILFVTALIALKLGSFFIPVLEAAKAIFGKAEDNKINTVIWNMRLPRVLTAILGGAGLGISGCVLQAILRNPLASASTLGISQGAAFGAAFAIIVLGAGSQGSSSASGVSFSNPVLITICAFIFSMTVSITILALARFVKISPQAMILSGVALSAVFTGATALLQYFANDVQLASVVFWTFGDLGRTSWKEIRIMAVIVTVFSLFFIHRRWDYNALESGEQTAVSLGVNVGVTRIVNMVFCSVTAAVVVSFLGIVNFIGLIAPHIVRRFIGNNYSYLLIGSCLTGSILLLLGDLAARMIAAPVILPIGAITSFFGGPLFLYILFRDGEKQKW
ncbi:MAG: iron ABC transporter permease [Treponema sp.]|jgi:iron complex transport system permease protein|nr:iron ABC transporter permease [Treponema sp.]